MYALANLRHDRTGQSGALNIGGDDADHHARPDRPLTGETAGIAVTDRSTRISFACQAATGFSALL